MTMSRTETAVNIDIQDVISGKLLVPHHIEFGYATPSDDYQTEVRAIDIPVEVQVRNNKKVLFRPGSRSSNIEAITYSCILLNDLLDMEEVQVPAQPKNIYIELSKILNLVDQDDLPISWFIYHRNKNILKVNLEISIGEDESFNIEAGKSWEYMMDKLHKIMNSIELDRNKKDPTILKKDYSKVRSSPAISKRMDIITKEPSTRVDDNFMSDAKNILK